jgi:REP element-mobilizing transposase RayT
MAFFDPCAPVTKHTRDLPHWEQNDVWCFLTWRLTDSLPQTKLHELQNEKLAWLNLHPQPWTDEIKAEYHDRFAAQIDKWLDRGTGSCLLRKPHNAKIVANAFLHFDKERYELDAFVVMPNHVHALVKLFSEHPLERIVKSWKGFTAQMINRREGRTGPVWQSEYWDRLIRTPAHFANYAEYIALNPAKAGLRAGQYILRPTQRGTSF